MSSDRKTEKKSVNMLWWKGEKVELEDSFFENANDIIAEIKAKLDSVKADKTSSALKQEKIKLLEGLIKHYIDLSKTLDVRRTEYFKAGLQIFTVAVAGMGIIIKFLEPANSIVFWICLSLSLGLTSLIITSFLVINKYYWQSNSERYHFLKIDPSQAEYLGNSWLWFYHGVPSISNINFKKVKEKEQEKNNRNGALQYLRGAKYYFEHFINSTEEDIFLQHLRHTYLLLVHNAYKNKFERQLTDLLAKGTKATGVITLLSVIISLSVGFCLSLPFNGSKDIYKVRIDTDSLDVKIHGNTNVIVQNVDTIINRLNARSLADTVREKSTIEAVSTKSNTDGVKK